MLRVVAALAALPLLLVLALAGALELREGKLGSLTTEAFELGLLPLVLLVLTVVLAVFVPLLLLTSRFTAISLWNSVVLGFMSALLPVLFSASSVLADTRLRLVFRMERLTDSFPWLILGSTGGLLFWLLAVARNRALHDCSEMRNLKGTPREA